MQIFEDLVNWPCAFVFAEHRPNELLGSDAMFSYLRPTGRRVPSSNSNQGVTSEGNREETSSQDTCFQSRDDSEPIYRSIVSPTAPVLPPIPRVASVYRPSTRLPSFGDDVAPKHVKDNYGAKQEFIAELEGSTPLSFSNANKSSSRSDSTTLQPENNHFSRPIKPDIEAEEKISVVQEHEDPGPPTASHHRSATRDSSVTGKRPKSRAQSQPATENHSQLDDARSLEAREKASSIAESDTLMNQRRDTSVEGRYTQHSTSSMKDISAVSSNESRAVHSSSPRSSPDPPREDKIPHSSRPTSQVQQSAWQGGNDAITFDSLTKQPQLSSLQSIGGQQRFSRPMLTRLNPMSLLARRRSSQPNSEVDNEAVRRKIAISKALPDDYDPRIRGNRVHDFSAPRPHQSLTPIDVQAAALGKRKSSTLTLSDQSIASTRDRSSVIESAPRRESDHRHTPVFTERFDIDTWRFDENDRRNKSTTGILDRLPPESSEEFRPALPPFAQKFPEIVRDPLLMSDPTFAVAPKPAAGESDDSSSGTCSEDLSPSSPSFSQKSSPSPPARSPSRTTSKHESISSSTDTSKHLQSNSSRFSFDMVGIGSAMQEKLLEDKHRQKHARKGRMSRASAISAAATDEDFDYDDVDFDDGLEEPIPGINADDEDDTVSKMIASSTLARENSGDIVSAPSRTTNQLYSHANTSLGVNTLSGGPVLKPSNLWSRQPAVGSDNLSHNSRINHDDLYFDDGMIEDADLQESGQFDESVFDDEGSRIYGRPLRELEREPLSAVPEVEDDEDSSMQSTRPISLESSLATGQNQAATADTSRTSVQPPEKNVAGKRGSLLRQDWTAQGFDYHAGLTKDNLAAYHDALASATQKAASEGRFDRKTSLDEPTNTDGVASQPTHVTFDDQLPARTSDGLGIGMNMSSSLDEYEQDEDDIIAAANAEALENDDEGFYGREFGFYARSNGSSEAEFVNGGYFGPPGSNEIKRSHSGRVNGQEPSLTPITERSEFSQRNSMISLPIHSGHGSFPPSIQTPGLAQLADSMQYEDDSDMSLSTLMRLRQNAWGGSSSSLHSNNASSGKSASPPTNTVSTSMPPPPRPLAPGLQPPSSRDSKHRPNPLNLPASDGLVSPRFPPPVSGGSEPIASPMRRNAIKGHGSPVKAHSRTSSGQGPSGLGGSNADSVAYIKEKDEEGARWVMERRRTVEGGQVEVLGRQLVEGGTI